MKELLTTAEVAEYLRIKERTVYELVRTRRIPCSRVTGRLIFPKSMIDAWVRSQVEYREPLVESIPPVIAGSHDPLLEWAVRESGCDLAIMAGGSADGLRRLELGQAIAAGLHIFDPPSGDYNKPFLASAPGDVVLINWAWREQGLIVTRNNPRRIRGIGDLAQAGVVVAHRQEGSGSQILLRHLLTCAGIPYERLTLLEPAMRTETDLAAAVLDGRADCGLAIASVARRHRLRFIALQRERFDLAMRVRDYFRPLPQRLLWFARDPAFGVHAAALGGYDLSETGRVIHAAP